MAIPKIIEELAHKIRTAIYGKDVRESLASGIEKAGEIAEDARKKSDETDSRQTELETRFEQQIQNMTLEDPSSAEIVDARGGETLLRHRLDKVDAHLAQNEQDIARIDAQARTQLQVLNEKVDENHQQLSAQLAQKANQSDVLNSLNTKRDKSVKIELEDLSANTLAAIEGGEGTNFNLLSVPQDKSVTIDKISDDLSSFLYLKDIFGTTLNWEVGTIRTSDGTNNTNTQRMRTSEYLYIDKGVIGLTDYTNYQIGVYIYDLDKNFLRSDGFVSEDTIINNPCYIRIVITKNPPADITEPELISISEKCVIRKQIFDVNTLPNNSITLSKVDFIKGVSGNLFDGVYHKLYVRTSDNTVDAVDSPELRRTAIIPIENGKSYRIETIGTHDRFVVGLANSYNHGDSLQVIQNINPSEGNENFEFENTDYKYVLITLTKSSQEPDVKIYENEPLKIGERQVITDREQQLVINEIENLKKELELANNASDIYLSELTDDRPPELASELYARYDNLLNKYPEYITKTELGRDGINNPIYEYVFKTPNYNSYDNRPRNQGAEIIKPKVLIVAGIHGNERNAVQSVYNFCKDISDNKKGAKLSALREAIEFRVIPVAVPSSFDQNTRVNHNLVNVNRNFTYGWTFQDHNPQDYSGESPASELETQILESWMEEHDDAIYYMDYHNSGYSQEVTYINTNNTVPHGESIIKAFFKYVGKVAWHWRNTYGMPNEMPLGYTGYNPGFSSSRKQADSLGIPSMALEMSWQVPVDSTRFGPVTNAIGTEFLGNFLIELCKEYTD